jgi:hypothetical protein
MMRTMSTMALLAVPFAVAQTTVNRRRRQQISSLSTHSATVVINATSQPGVHSTSSCDPATVHQIIQRDTDLQSATISDTRSCETAGREGYQNVQLCVNIKEVGSTGILNKAFEHGRRLKDALDFSVAKEPSFLKFAAIDCLLSFATTNVQFTLPLYAKERGFAPSTAANFLSIISVSEIVGGFSITPLYDCVNYEYLSASLQVMFAGILVGEF